VAEEAEERAESRPTDQAARIDTTVAHPARVYDFYVHAWRPDAGDVPPEGGVSAYGGVAIKP